MAQTVYGGDIKLCIVKKKKGGGRGAWEEQLNWNTSEWK